jgi:hypothetical protein
MKGINFIKHTLVGTGLSILIFFSISFLTVLSQINPLFNIETEDYILEIGFPFVYNVQFCLAMNRLEGLSKYGILSHLTFPFLSNLAIKISAPPIPSK